MFYIFLADGFEEIEALCPYDLLLRAGIPTKTVSINETTLVTGTHGIKVHADITLSEMEEEFEGIMLPGGLPGATNLYDDERVINLLYSFAAENKITAAICAAPMVLDKAGLLENRSFTMYPAEDLYKYLRDNKRPQSDLVVVDGKVITGKGPGATFKFAAAIAEALQVSPETVKNVLSGMFVNC